MLWQDAGQDYSSRERELSIIPSRLARLALGCTPGLNVVDPELHPFVDVVLLHKAKVEDDRIQRASERRTVAA